MHQSLVLAIWLRLRNCYCHAYKKEEDVLANQKNCVIHTHSVSALEPVIIPPACQRFCHLNINRCHCGAFDKMIDAIVLLPRVKLMQGWGVRARVMDGCVLSMYCAYVSQRLQEQVMDFLVFIFVSHVCLRQMNTNR